MYQPRTENHRKARGFEQEYIGSDTVQVIEKDGLEIERDLLDASSAVVSQGRVRLSRRDKRLSPGFQHRVSKEKIDPPRRGGRVAIVPPPWHRNVEKLSAALFLLRPTFPKLRRTGRAGSKRHCPGVKTPGSVLSSLRDESDTPAGRNLTCYYGTKSDRSIDLLETDPRPANPTATRP